MSERWVDNIISSVEQLSSLYFKTKGRNLDLFSWFETFLKRVIMHHQTKCPVTLSTR